MKLVRLILVLWLICAAAAGTHDGLDLPAPIAVPEAWNIITLCQANLKKKLIKERQWQEVPVQVFLSEMAVRFLQQNLPLDASEV